MRTDGGGEFKSSFAQYLSDHHIYHSVSIPNRHKQMANVESLNKSLGKIFMTYLSDQTYKRNYEYNEWTDIVDAVRKELNEIRNHPKDQDPADRVPPLPSASPPKYEIGQLVYRRLEKPVDRFGNKYMNSKFRQGDNRFEINEPRKIVKILVYGKSYRYILNNLPNVSYDEAEIIPAKETEEKFIILKIIGKKIVKKEIYYLVWWKYYKKSEATWVRVRDNLIPIFFTIMINYEVYYLGYKDKIFPDS